MRLALTFVTLLLVALGSRADTVYLDELVEMPQSALQNRFPGLKKQGCYRIAEDRYLSITMQRRGDLPLRVTVAMEPCRRPVDIAGIEVQHRSGANVGGTTVDVVTKLGQPHAAAAPDSTQERLGDTEYLYICQISQGCNRHTSVFIRDGIVTAISEWHSE